MCVDWWIWVALSSVELRSNFVFQLLLFYWNKNSIYFLAYYVVLFSVFMYWLYFYYYYCYHSYLISLRRALFLHCVSQCCGPWTSSLVLKLARSSKEVQSLILNRSILQLLSSCFLTWRVLLAAPCGRLRWMFCTDSLHLFVDGVDNTPRILAWLRTDAVLLIY